MLRPWLRSTLAAWTGVTATSAFAFLAVHCGGSGAAGHGTGSGDGSLVTKTGASGDSGNSMDGGDATMLAESGGAADASADEGVSPTDGPVEACSGLACQVHACPDGGTTSISGTVYDPAGRIPLSGVTVFVPSSPVLAMPSGANATTCAQLYTGDPLVGAVTDENGSFHITGAPDGAGIPLVVQIGKWRRQLTLNVAACQDTTPSADGGAPLTLPKNGTEGDMPNIAVSTGGADTLECLLLRMGVDSAEYTPGAGGGKHVHIFQGANGPNTSPAAPKSSASLWASDADMSVYDLVMLSCEGSETTNMNQQVLFDYTQNGGRVFASHFHYSWFNTGPFAAYDLATWTAGSNQIGNSLNANINTSFPTGQRLQSWLSARGGLTNGELTVYQPRHNANLAAGNTTSQPWLTADSVSSAPGAVQQFTFDTPLGTDAGASYGRVAFTDMHVEATAAGVTADYSGGSNVVPAGCAVRDLQPQEMAMEFMLFDLTTCLSPGGGEQTGL